MPCTATTKPVAYPAYLRHLNLWFKRHCQSVFSLLRYKNSGKKNPKKIQKRKLISRKKIKHSKLRYWLPGKVSYVCYMPEPKNLDFLTDMSGRFGRFQKGSKTTKMTKSPQKSQKFDNLSVLAKIIGPAVRFDQFWAQSDQKKSIFSTFEKIWDFPIVIWPNPKSGPFGQILAPKIWSWSIFIS